MKKILFSLIIATILFAPTSVEARGSYSFKSYKSSTTQNYKYGGQLKLQNGYFKRSGQYVQPHFKTGPDQYNWNNRKNLYGW